MISDMLMVGNIDELVCARVVMFQQVFASAEYGFGEIRGASRTNRGSAPTRTSGACACRMMQQRYEGERTMHLQTLCNRLQFTAAIALLVTAVALLPTAPAQAADKETDALRKRVEQLEEQIVDMQVVIGTLQSLGGGSAGGSSSGAAVAGNYSGGGGTPQDRARMDSMETQIRALTAQLERVQRRPQSNSGAAAGQNIQGYGDNYSTELPGRKSRAREPNGFGSTTVTQQIETDPIGGFINGQYGDQPQARRAPSSGQQPQTADDEKRYAARRGLDFSRSSRETVGGNPKALYETAYGYLLQQDYGAAEVAFSDFLQRYPRDDLSGNAQYWLGESHYVRGQYKSAAGAFLKGYQTYSKSSKAPDSLLKLAMSLDRLGQKDAACSSYTELVNRFPKAPAHVKNRAASERRRVGC